MAVAITRDPASVNGYVVRLHPATEFFAVAYIVGIAAVARASLARRIAILGHGVLYLAMSVLLQALLIVAGLATGWPIAPFGIEATLANLLVGGLVITRMTFTCYTLPRATTVPVERPRWMWDSVLAGCSLVAVVALLVVELRVSRRARQPDLGMAGLRAAVRGEHPVRAAVRAVVAAVVDQPQASSSPAATGRRST